MEPHTGNLLATRAPNIEAVLLYVRLLTTCSVTPRPRLIESGYEGKLSEFTFLLVDNVPSKLPFLFCFLDLLNCSSRPGVFMPSALHTGTG